MTVFFVSYRDTPYMSYIRLTHFMYQSVAH